ncbi:MAG: hypothetical protein LBS72_03205 [Oscillospiraceae bacterium]|jgi:hypothetical protein|nr:hypothetical protein [Oscillospiraceae bacterium]
MANSFSDVNNFDELLNALGATSAEGAINIINISDDIDIDVGDWESLVTQYGVRIVIHGNGHSIGTTTHPLGQPLFKLGEAVDIDHLKIIASGSIPYFEYTEINLKYTGILFGEAIDCSVKHCEVEIDVESNGIDIIGGLIGLAEGCVVDRCSVSGTLKTNALECGGLIGEAYDTIVSNCVNNADIELDATNRVTGWIGVGGIAGYLDGASIVESCINNGMISANIGELDYEQNGLFTGGGIAAIMASASVRSCVNNGIWDIASTCEGFCSTILGGIVGVAGTYDEGVGNCLIGDNINRSPIPDSAGKIIEHAGGIVGYILIEGTNNGVYVLNNTNACVVRASMCAGGIVGLVNPNDNIEHNGQLFIHQNENLGSVIALSEAGELLPDGQADNYIETGVGGVIGICRTSASIKYNCVCVNTLKDDEHDKAYVGGVIGAMSDYESPNTGNVIVSHNYVKADTIISNKFARRIVGGVCAEKDPVLADNYAVATIRLTADNIVDECRDEPYVGKKYVNQLIDESDPDVGSGGSGLGGGTFDPTVNVPPIGDSFTDCMRGVYDDCKYAAPTNVAAEAQYALSGVVSSIANMESGLRSLLEAGASVIRQGLTQEPDAQELVGLNDSVMNIADGAKELEQTLVEKLSCATEYMTKFMESCGCDSEIVVEPVCVTLYAVTQTTRLPAQQAKYRLYNDTTGESTDIETDQTGKLILRLDRETDYTLELLYDGMWLPEIRHISVDADGGYTIDGKKDCCKGTCTMIIHRPDQIDESDGCKAYRPYAPICLCI